MTSIIEVTLQRRRSPVNFLDNFRTFFPKNTSGWLLLPFIKYRCSEKFRSICMKIPSMWSFISKVACLSLQIYWKKNNPSQLCSCDFHGVLRRDFSKNPSGRLLWMPTLHRPFLPNYPFLINYWLNWTFKSRMIWYHYCLFFSFKGIITKWLCQC